MKYCAKKIETVEAATKKGLKDDVHLDVLKSTSYQK